MASRCISRSWYERARPSTRSESATQLPMPGSVPTALYEPLVARLYATPTALPVAATAAAAGQEVDRSLLAAIMTIPAEELDSSLRDLRRRTDPGARRRSFRPGTSSGTSFFARSPTSCSLPRGAARSTAGCATSSPATSPVIGACSRRTSSARSATRRRRLPISTPRRRLAGGGRCRRLVLTWHGRSI